MKFNKLGPGCYILPESDRGPCFEFSLTSRFETNYRDKIDRSPYTDYLLKATHIKKRKQSSLKILKNKDMAPYRPDTKLTSIEKKAKDLEAKIKATQGQKKELLERKINKHLLVIKGKQKRTELRQHKQVRSP